MKQIHKTSPDDSAMPNQEHDGLTKREYFAIQVLSGLLANNTLVGYAYVKSSVAIADNLIKELNGENL